MLFQSATVFYTIAALSVSALLYKIWISMVEKRLDDDFAAKQGCRPIKTILGGKLPLGLDLVMGLLKANANQTIMSFLQPFIEGLGPNLELRLLGNAGFVTVDPDNVKAILSRSKFKEGELDFSFGQRRNALLPLFGDGIFTQDGRQWKHSRDMVRKQFARIQYHNLDIFTEHVEMLVSRISAIENSTVDLQPLFFNFTLDTSTSLLFGESAGSLHEESQDEFGSNMNDASWYSAIRVQLAYLYWLVCLPQYYQACNKVKDYTDKWVKKALDGRDEGDEKSDKYLFIRSLHEELKDRERVREQLVNILLAGRDTTACLLSWAFRLLVRHPTTLRSLQKEIKDVLGDDTKISKAKLQKMPYLKNVITETLRLYPPVPINFCEAHHTTILPHGGGPDGLSPVLLRKGMGVGFSPYYMHRRKDLYGEDAHSFRPERWEDGSLQERIGWAYLPFNAGPRICLGQEFALLEASYAVARIVQSFPNLALPEDEEVVPIGNERHSITLTMAPTDGCRVKLQGLS